MELTEYVADWVLKLSPEAIPEPARRVATRHLLDGYGLVLSGVREESHRILFSHWRSLGGSPEAYVLGTGERAPAEWAALLNGCAIHAADFDDTQLSSAPDRVYGLLTHPTAPVLGAAAAAAELARADGRALVTAYVAGVEVCCRIADAANPRHYHDGFHSTGTFGAFGAAAAAGKLLGLDRNQLLYAFGLAAPLGGGLRPNFGTMAKPFQAGIAAHAGVRAARLARIGFTASRAILEAPRGFFQATAGGHDPERIVGRLGNPFYFQEPGVSIKPYPCGSLLHPGADAVLALVKEHDIRPDDVEEAVAATNSAMPKALIYARPRTALEAKFSFPFVLAAAIVRRRLSLAEFTDQVVTSPAIQELLPRCHHVVAPDIDATGFQHMETRINLRLRDGRELVRTEREAAGHPRKPMSDEMLEGKFLDCAAGTLPEAGARRALELIRRVEHLGAAAEVHRALAPTVNSAARRWKGELA